jgi:diguanylate cyclase
VHYQPQVELGSREPVAFEALVRWQHPTRGLLAAEEFVPLAEESGLIVALGEHVLREACAEASRRGAPVCVNVAARQLSHPDLASFVAATLDATGLPGEQLCLEVGEAALTSESAPVLCSLADLGVRLALDDFGAGSAALAHLRDWPVELVKLDRTLLTDSPEVLGAIVALAQALGLEVVAEGVETPEQLALLDRLGCTRAQGFLLGAPEPAAAALHAA